MVISHSNVYPNGLKEFSVVFTYISLNHMSDLFGGVMNDISSTLKEVYKANSIALVPGVGTFAMAAALCSSTIKNLYTTDLLLTEHLNYTMLYNTSVDVNVMELDNYLPVFPCSWNNTEEQRKFIIDYR